MQELHGSTVFANLLNGFGVDEYLVRTEGANTRSFITDALGSTLALADSAGTLQTEYAYDPFGNGASTGVADGNAFGYTGRETDGTGLMYYRARYYNPPLQRFASRDPIGFAGGDVNLYAYVNGNPLSLIDPLGLASGTPVGSQIGGAASDFWKNYNDMRDANTIGGDKYFHCKANCEASRRGSAGEKTACMISDTREWVDQNIKGDPASASAADQVANAAGRSGATSSQLPCEMVCSSFRPNGLPPRY